MARGPRRVRATTEGIARALVDDFDWKTFEFSSAPGRPHPRALQFLLAAGLRLATPHAAKVALLGLGALAKSDLYDGVEGGFFEGCDRKGWKEPRTGKPLSLNAQFIEAFALAGAETGREEFTRTARETWAWVERALSRADDDLWAPGLPADDEYYALMRHARDRRGAPRPDDEIRTADCAATVSALAVAAAAGQERSLAGRARLALQSLLDNAVAEGHHVSPRMAGGDWEAEGGRGARVHLARAVADAWCVTGDRTLLPRLEEFAPAVDEGDDAAEGLSEGAEADRALVILRRGRISGDHGLRARAEAALLALPGTYGSGPSEAAARGMAELAMANGVITIQGVAGSALASAAFGRCAPFGPTVVCDGDGADRDENIIMLVAGAGTPREARRRGDLGVLANSLRAEGSSAPSAGARK